VTSAQTPARSGTALLPSRERFAAAEGQLFHPISDRPHFFDPEIGRGFRTQLADDVILMYPACSPWRDARGRLQLVGGWRRRRNVPGEADGPQSGLARYVFPGGQVLDRIACDPLVTGTPCWYPGTSTRILYPANDGALYQFSFAEEEAAGPATSPSRRPRRLTWRCPPPGIGAVIIQDPTWPTDPRLGGRLLVTLSYVVRKRDQIGFTAKQIWWLRLSRDGAAIEEAGRLIVPDEPGNTASAVAERLPSLWSGPDGVVLAFLSYIRNETGSRLQVAPVVFDPTTKAPRVFVAKAAVLAEDRMTVVPVFSSDGRWVLSARLAADARDSLDRFSVSGALALARVP
jgi:hypothetical protein